MRRRPVGPWIAAAVAGLVGAVILGVAVWLEPNAPQAAPAGLLSLSPMARISAMSSAVPTTWSMKPGQKPGTAGKVLKMPVVFASPGSKPSHLAWYTANTIAAPRNAPMNCPAM